MRKPLVVALCALAFAGAGATPAVAAAPTPTGADTTTDAAPTALTDLVNDTVGAAADALSGLTAPKAGAVSFAGTVSLSNCSGSVVRMPGSAPDDPALVLTNGHCLEGGFPAPGQVLVDRASSRGVGLLNSSGSQVATLRAERLVYATMTDTDAAVYRLGTTYAQIKSAYGIDPLTLSATRPVPGNSGTVSGYRTQVQSSLLSVKARGLLMSEVSAIARVALSDNAVGGPTAGRAESDACGGPCKTGFLGDWQGPVKQEPVVVSRRGTDRNLQPSCWGGRQWKRIYIVPARCGADRFESVAAGGQRGVLRTARPARTSVRRPSSMTNRPSTITYGIPVGSVRGSAKLDPAATVRGSNSTRSARWPSRISPRSVSPSRAAGRAVRCATHSSSDSTPSSRT